MNVAINIPIVSGGRSGGVEQFFIGLVSGLNTVDGHEFVLVTHPRDPDWIRAYASEEMAIVPRPWNGITERTKAVLGPLTPFVSPIVRPFFEYRSDDEPSVPDAGGFYASQGVDIVHFPNQVYARTELPCIFNPHDLQHEHYPEYFSESELAQRRFLYRTACREAAAVEVPSHFVREDLIDQYDVDPSKVYVVERGPPVELYEPPTDEILRSVRRQFDLPDAFALYPARTWPHKNHGRLLEAIAELRDSYDEQLTLICTGGETDHLSDIKRNVEILDLNDQVGFLGFVEPTTLRALYRLSEFVVFPSKFEGGGFPLLEAWAEGTPVACSNVTSLSEKAGDAAYLFDPDDVGAITDALLALHTDPQRRQTLVKHGSSRVKEYSWERAAATYSALYTHVGGESLTNKERARLEAAQQNH
jgi:glycosyltransferase involved in cell wall biosynthesis